jgi:heme/copper-type cytochrome/quinol oxidase subunit 2
MTAKPMVKTSRVMPKATRKLARRGEFNILWVIVAVVAIVLALFIIFFVFHGAVPSLRASNTLTVTTEEMGGTLVINIKATGTSGVPITGITLLPSGASASSCTAYYNGNTYSGITSLPVSGSASSPVITLYPGDTLSLVCSGLSGSPTEVEVTTTGSTYIAPIA